MVTYRGDRATIQTRTSTLLNASAFKIANLIIFCMLNRVCQILSILSFIMVSSVIGGSYFGYKYVTSEQFKAKIMNQVMGNVKGMLPNVMDNALPKTTGPSITIPKIKL